MDEHGLPVEKGSRQGCDNIYRRHSRCNSDPRRVIRKLGRSYFRHSNCAASGLGRCGRPSHRRYGQQRIYPGWACVAGWAIREKCYSDCRVRSGSPRQGPGCSRCRYRGFKASFPAHSYDFACVYLGRTSSRDCIRGWGRQSPVGWNGSVRRDDRSNYLGSVLHARLVCPHAETLEKRPSGSRSSFSTPKRYECTVMEVSLLISRGPFGWCLQARFPCR